ncbi:glycosyltransferase [Sulfuracidifex tepidarius]|uniref:glycosyltransferase n=1 Tax=Sulfuracidifex tepidarius TaxID=1294262 RepID=UPI0006D26117|nr:glycosyltransferase family A protein [Sulfuracidifex tepidarius]
MDVTIGIPTFKNDGRTILYTLQSLTKQTYADFKVLIAYKPSENDRTLDVIEKFTKSLDLKIMFQREGYFDEALNMIYSTSKSDILISTDDDAVPSTNWVESHIRAHENFYDAGVIGPFLGISHRSSLIARLYSNIFEDPLEEDMRLSNNYFAKTGILVRNNLFRNAGSKVRTFNPIGVNMSIKKEVYSDFKLPNMTAGYKQ